MDVGDRVSGCCDDPHKFVIHDGAGVGILHLVPIGSARSVSGIVDGLHRNRARRLRGERQWDDVRQQEICPWGIGWIVKGILLKVARPTQCRAWHCSDLLIRDGLDFFQLRPGNDQQFHLVLIDVGAAHPHHQKRSEAAQNDEQDGHGHQTLDQSHAPVRTIPMLRLG